MTAGTIVHGRPVAGAPKPEPIATRREHPFRFVGQIVLTLAWTAVIVHILDYDWKAIYFFLTQNWLVKPHYDAAIPWPILRHFLRDSLEALLATTGAWFALQNRWSKANQRPFTLAERFFDKIGWPSRAQQERTHPWQFWAMFPLTVAAALPGIGAAFGALLLSTGFGTKTNAIRDAVTKYSNRVHASAHMQSLASNYVNSFLADWPLKLAGILGGLFFAKVVFTKIATDGQRHLVERRAAWYLTSNWRVVRRWARPRWPLPVGFRAEFNSSVVTYANRLAKGEDLPRPHVWVTVLQLVAIPALLALAYRGWYIMQYIAPHAH